MAIIDFFIFLGNLFLVIKALQNRNHEACMVVLFGYTTGRSAVQNDRREMLPYES
jgi:ActR/RegA family two-component response regulator